jgi:hypothetical protein
MGSLIWNYSNEVRGWKGRAQVINIYKFQNKRKEEAIVYQRKISESILNI